MDHDIRHPVPPYPPENINSAMWYCLYCIFGNLNEYSLKTHLRNVHGFHVGYEPVMGDDFTNGVHLRVMLERWTKYILTAQDKFALSIASLRGADDFAQEVGDGLKDS